MSRNDSSRFVLNPQVDIQRSKFLRNSSVKLSFNAGDCIPFYIDEVLPGDTFNVRTSKVVRMQPLVTPILDNIFLDTYWFYVPNRLVWDHWRELNGENTTSAWTPNVEYEVPQITSPDGGWNVGTVADYLGIPTGVSNLSISALPFRAYSLIMNEWFRSENLTDPLNIPKDDINRKGSNGDNYLTDCVLGGKPFVASKMHDYFTSALPAPQKGPDVTIPVAEGGAYPVFATSNVHDFITLDQERVPLYFANTKNDNGLMKLKVKLSSEGSTGSSFPEADDTGSYDVLGTGSDNASNLSYAVPANLWALSSGNAQAASINSLRLAFQIQRLLEKDARGGTRYTEILKEHFGVTSPDSRLQRPEYLGGNRIPVNINQVTQQSGTAAGTTPQGTVTGMSLSMDSDDSFVKSFVEHGYVIGIMVARYPHSYQQGIDRMWSRKSRFDFYWPSLAHIGEQAILNKEIYAQGTDEDDEVFGYQEAWSEYKFKPSRISGELRSQYSASLDMWHLADDYDALPRLSDDWIREDGAVIDRVLAVSSAVSNQFFADIYVQNETIRPMPMYSIPGLIDHF